MRIFFALSFLFVELSLLNLCGQRWFLRAFRVLSYVLASVCRICASGGQMGAMDCRCAYFLVSSYRFEPRLLVIDFFSWEQAWKSLLPRLVEVACSAASLVLPLASFTTGSRLLLIDWRSRHGGMIVSAGSSFCWCLNAPSIFGWIGYGFVS